MKGWPVGGQLPKVTRGELADMSRADRAVYHSERARVFVARATACAWLAGVTAVTAVILAVLSLVI